MKSPEDGRQLLIDLDTKHCTLDAASIEKIERMLDPIRKPVAKFPISTLYVTVERHPKHHDYRVKTALRLTGKTLTTGDVADSWVTALEGCVSKLVHRLTAYSREMSGAAERHKRLNGTRHDVEPEQAIDVDAVDAAVADQDYERFRTALYDYEESVRKRIGRWIQRYPDLESQLGARFDLADVVEEVFLTAFDQYDKRPKDVLFGDWLERLIDPALKLLQDHTTEELENVAFVRSMRS